MSNIHSNTDVNQSSVLFVDPTVKNYQNLLTGVNPGTEIVILDTFRDGIQQISETLAKSRSLSSVHILSHGDTEGVQLGNTRLDYRTLDRYSQQIQGWSKSLTADADILFYGCNVAAGGTQLINQIDRLTGADVAASDDLTGSAALGGDWNLETKTGAIESSLAFQSDVLEGYDAVLASFNFANFADTSPLTINGNAAKSGNALRLTPSVQDQVGTTFYSTPVDITANTSFQTQFQFNLSGGTGGADGFTFLLQNDADGAGAIAGGGGNVGYGGVNAITNSLAIEFDTYRNEWDTNNNHVALLRDGAITTALATANPTIDLNSGSLVNAWVDYNGTTNRLEVFLSSSTTKPTTSLLSQTIDLSAVVGNRAYVGFTAATGGFTNAQDINSWQFSSSEPGTPGTGTGNGLRGEYYDNIDFTNPRITRIDPTVNFNWGNGSPDANIGADTFSAVWSGQVQPLYSETYTFSTRTDDGVRLFVNNQLVIDNYRDQSPTERSGTITLQAGQKYDIRMEYYENRGGAVAQLSWASASQVKQIIPQSQLYSTAPPPPSTGNGLKGEYFDNRDFTNLVLTRNDSTVNFDWGNGSPDARIGNDTFSVRWTGQVQPLYSETYTFSTTTDDGLQLYIDDRLIIDHLRDQSPTEKTGTITLQAGRKYNIRMDYYENGGGAVAKLAWASPSQSKQIIPQSQLFNTATNPGVLAIGDTQVSVNENGATANITVVRTGGSDGVATLDYTTLDGSASAGNDYTAQSGTLTFASGVTSQVISIPILDDTLIEGNELFSVAVDRPTGATLRAPRTAQITIVDNDVPAGETFLLDFPNFANASRLQLNGSAAATGNVLRLNNGLFQGGSAFYKDALSLDTNTSFQTQFQFRLNGGDGTEGADGFTFMLQDTPAGNLTLGDAGGGLGYSGTGAKSLAIEFDTYDNGDADPNDNSIAILRDGVTVANLAVVNAPFDLNSSVPLNAWVDYNGSTDRLDIYLANTLTKPSTALLSQTIDLTAILGNSAYIGFSGGTGGLFNNQDIENWKFTTNAQSPTLGFSRPTYQVDEAAGTAIITIRRGANASAGAASVNYTTSNGTATAGDYTLTSGTVNFAAGETEKTFTIAINNDTEVERNETINITLSNPIGATLGNQSSAVLTILDNDAGNFVRETVVSGLNLPTAFEWAAGSDRLYIAEKGGVVKVVENGVTSVFLDLSDEVNSAVDNDRGLLALTLHPDFVNNPYVYLGYTYDPPEAATGTGLAARDQNGNRPSRLIRVTADASTGYKTIVPNSTVVLLGTNSNWAYTSRPDVNSTDSITTLPSGIVNGTTITAPASLIDGNGNIRDYLATDSQSHTIGDVAFGTDGSLFVSNGDGASFGRVDPRASRVLDINNLSGKMLRIDPITGAGLADNPFYQSSNPNSNASKVYSYGLRNPFRFVINPATNEPVIGDVGWTSWEEINTGRGKNFGWPYYEGGNGANLQTGGYSELTDAQAYYATGATITPAIYAISHADGASAISMGDYYTGTTFPSIYQGGLFFSDIVSGQIDVLLFNPDGTVNSVKRFASGGEFSYTSQMTTRNSDLYYSSLQAGTISRWRAV